MLRSRLILLISFMILFGLLSFVTADANQEHSSKDLKAAAKKFTQMTANKFAHMKELQNESIEITIKQYNRRINEIEKHPLLTEDQKQQQIAFYQHLIYRARVKHIISEAQMDYHKERESNLEKLKISDNI